MEIRTQQQYQQDQGRRLLWLLEALWRMEALKTRCGSDSVLQESLRRRVAWAVACGDDRGGFLPGSVPDRLPSLSGGSLGGLAVHAL